MSSASLYRHLRSLLDDKPDKYVVGVRIEIAAWDRQALVIRCSNKLLLTELTIYVHGHRFRDRHCLAIVGNICGHIQEAAFTVGFQLQDQRRSEVLGITANLEKRSVVDGGWVGASAIRPAVDVDWVVIYQINAQGDARDFFEIVTGIEVIVDYCLKLVAATSSRR